MSSVSAPTRTARLDNFAWWHRLRRHKIERGGQWWSGWNSGMLALVLHCQKMQRRVALDGPVNALREGSELGDRPDVALP